jgi:eukaryotic-like serine/threonine-protein kinase
MAERVCPNCNTPYQEGKEVCACCGYILPSGTTIPEGAVLRGKYEIQKLLHSGGMGYIYLAKDKNLFDRLCVLKQVRERIQSDEHRKKLEEEALRMSRLNHPNIAMIFDHFIESGFYFLVEERISGKTLSEVFRERQCHLTEDEVVNWAVSICDVIAYIHHEGIIHRDISPDNIMLTDDGNIRFIDFGTLRELRNIDAGHTAGMGKHGYTPPEQWQGKAEPGSDIFALGATIYYLLTGFLPLSTSYRTGQSPQEEDFYPRFPPIRTHNPQVSPNLEAVLEKALELDIHRRFASAIEMQRMLSSLRPEATKRVSNPPQLVLSPGPGSGVRWLAVLSAMQHPATLLPLAICLLAVIYFSLLSPFFGGRWSTLPVMAVFGIAAIASCIYIYRKEYRTKTREPGKNQGQAMTNGQL